MLAFMYGPNFAKEVPSLYLNIPAKPAEGVVRQQAIGFALVLYTLI